MFKKYTIYILLIICVLFQCASKLRPFFDAGRATSGIIWILKEQHIRKTDYRYVWSGEIGRIIAEESRSHGVDIDAMVVLAFTESSFHMDAIGSKGEMGMYQLYARYAEEMKKRMDKYRANVEIGARRLAIAVRVCTEKGKKQSTWEEIYGHYRSSRCNEDLGDHKGKLLRRMKLSLNNQ